LIYPLYLKENTSIYTEGGGRNQSFPGLFPPAQLHVLRKKKDDVIFVLSDLDITQFKYNQEKQ